MDAQIYRFPGRDPAVESTPAQAVSSPRAAAPAGSPSIQVVDYSVPDQVARLVKLARDRGASLIEVRNALWGPR